MSERDEESIFSEAIGKSPEEQARILAGACEGRPKLRKAVESLLDAYQYGSCLEPPDNANDESTFAADETGKQVGPYRLLEKIGEGGMGAVYMAEQRRPFKRRVALKIIKLGMDEAVVLRHPRLLYPGPRSRLALGK